MDDERLHSLLDRAADAISRARYHLIRNDYRELVHELRNTNYALEIVADEAARLSNDDPD